LEPLHPNQGVGDWRLPPLQIGVQALGSKPSDARLIFKKAALPMIAWDLPYHVIDLLLDVLL